MKEEQAVETQEATEVEQPENQEQPEPREVYTKEDIDNMIAEAKAEAKREAEETYKGIQRVVAKKDQEIQKLRTSQPVQSTKALEMMVEELKANRDPLDPPSPKIQQIESEIARIKQEETALKQLRDVEAYTEQWKDKITQKIEQANLNPESDIFDDVWEAFEMTYQLDGKFERVDKKVDKILKGAVKEMPEEPKKAEKPDVDKLIEERVKEEKRKWMEENNLLEKETGLPSGDTSDAAFIARMGDPNYVATKADLERADKILNK